MSAELIVIEHSHDVSTGVYRVVLGYAIEEQRPAMEDDGVTPQREPGTLATALKPKVDEDGGLVMEDGGPVMEEQPVLDEDGKQVVWPGEMIYEDVTHYMPVEDFVFAADDSRWEGKSPEDVATEQRAVIRDALAARGRAAREAEAERAAAHTQLPGAGEAL